jgi:hypothetical protein
MAAILPPEGINYHFRLDGLRVPMDSLVKLFFAVDDFDAVPKCVGVVGAGLAPPFGGRSKQCPYASSTVFYGKILPVYLPDDDQQDGTEPTGLTGPGV